MKPQPGQCRCGAEWTTVIVSTPHAEVALGQRCAGIVEAVLELQGLTPKRRPMLEAVK